MPLRKVLLISLILSNLSCANFNLTDNQSIKFNQVLNFKVDSTSSLEVIKDLGQPDTINKSASLEEWNYLDNNKSQRLTLTFSAGGKVLQSILWLPRMDEEESNFKNMISHFPNLKIDPKDEGKVNPHSPIEEVVYRDNQSLLVVIVNETRAKVVALAWYSRNARDVSGVPSPKKKFTIGE